MALTMYMKVTGKNQGEIKGSCDQGGDKKDKILVYAMDHKVEIPKDTHTGLPTGQRIHHPLTVTKARKHPNHLPGREQTISRHGRRKLYLLQDYLVLH